MKKEPVTSNNKVNGTRTNKNNVRSSFVHRQSDVRRPRLDVRAHEIGHSSILIWSLEKMVLIISFETEVDLVFQSGAARRNTRFLMANLKKVNLTI